MGQLWRTAAAELRAWSYQGARRMSIPFQLDNCDAKGQLILGTRDAPEQPARLGPRSVVLIPLDRAGEHATASDWGMGYFEIHVYGSKGRTEGWMYFGRGDGSLELAAEDDVDYDPDRDRVHARRYTLGFGRPQVDYFSVADGKGADRGNLIYRLKARVEARILQCGRSYPKPTSRAPTSARKRMTNEDLRAGQWQARRLLDRAAAPLPDAPRSGCACRGFRALRKAASQARAATGRSSLSLVESDEALHGAPRARRSWMVGRCRARNSPDSPQQALGSTPIHLRQYCRNLGISR